METIPVSHRAGGDMAALDPHTAPELQSSTLCPPPVALQPPTPCPSPGVQPCTPSTMIPILGPASSSPEDAEPGLAAPHPQPINPALIPCSSPAAQVLSPQPPPLTPSPHPAATPSPLCTHILGPTAPRPQPCTPCPPSVSAPELQSPAPHPPAPIPHLPSLQPPLPARRPPRTCCCALRKGTALSMWCRRIPLQRVR